jgi:predicted DNA-binding antitoxin AbrB/MazE fold protein
MQTQAIDAVFENGVFRPLQPVTLPESQRVTLLVPTEEEELDKQTGYEPLPFRDVKTIRVQVKRVGDFGLLPIAVDQEEE